MNKTDIEWADYSWNPLTGCLHDCEYCYARRLSARFSGDVRAHLADKQCKKEGDIYILDEPFIGDTGSIVHYPFGFAPTYHKYRLDWPDGLKSSFNIFVGSMTDVFGDWVPMNIVEDILEKCQEYNRHNYLFLTKAPQNYFQLVPLWKTYHDKDIYKNIWWGTSITTRKDWSRAYIVGEMAEKYKLNTFLSIEPILEYLKSDFITEHIKWVIIGAETGNRKGKVIPKKEWIDKIVNRCDKLNIPVFMKDSLFPIMGEDMRYDFPKALQNKPISKKLHDKLYDRCRYCDTDLPMKEMIALLYRIKRGESAKKLGYACVDCFNKEFGGLLDEKEKMQNDSGGEKST